MIHRNNRRLLRNWLWLGVVAANAWGSSGEEPRDANLDELVVVATSHARRVMDTPATVHAIDLERLHLERQPRTLTDALDAIPGIMLQKTGYGMTSPYLRGMTGQRVLMLADGVRLNTTILRDGPNQYWNLLGTYLYDEVDVLMGPASVLYGSDAVGGVVMARTRPLPQGLADGGWQWLGGTAVGRVASAERSFSQAIAGNLAWNDRFSLRLALENHNFGNLRTGGSTKNPDTGYDQWGGAIRATWWLEEGQAIHLGFDHYDQDDVDRVHATTAYPPWHGTVAGTDGRRVYDHDRQAAFIRYEWREREGWLRDLEIGLAWQQLAQEYHRYRTNGSLRADEPTRVDSFGAWFRLASPSPFGTWTYGGDWWGDYASSWNNLDPAAAQGEFGDNATAGTFGLFVQNELPLGERLELITALRYSYAELEARRVEGYGSLNGHWDALTASARLAWSIRPDTLLHIGLAQGFRAPNLADCTRLGEYASGSFEAPTGLLGEERYLTYEIGAKNQGAWGQILLTAYHTVSHDQNARLTLDGNAIKQNLDRGYVQGVELKAQANLAGGFLLFGSLGWQQGKEDTYRNDEILLGETEQYISRLAPLGGDLGLRWTSPAKRFWTEARLRWAKRQDHLSFGDQNDTQRIPPGGTPGYGVADLRGGWRIDERTDLALALENLADKDYRIHGSGSNEPGRNLVLTLRRTF